MNSKHTSAQLQEDAERFDASIADIEVLKHINLPVRRWVIYCLDFLNSYDWDAETNLKRDLIPIVKVKNENPNLFDPEGPPLAMWPEINKHVDAFLDGPAQSLIIPSNVHGNFIIEYAGKTVPPPPEPVPKDNMARFKDGKLNITDRDMLAHGGDDIDSDSEETSARFFSAISQRPIDMSKMNLISTYRYLTNKMSPEALRMFNDLLVMPTADISAMCWALKLGNCAMLSKPLTTAEIINAAGLPDVDVLNPYDFMNILSDTISTRVIAHKGFQFFMDPGTVDLQVVVCRIGAVIVHSKHNVAYGIEENQFLLHRFVHLYSTSNRHVVSVIQNKMSMLPTTAVSGVYMKYRPKRVCTKRIDITGEKVKDYNRFEIEMKRHGVYPLPPCDMPPNLDLMSLAMTTLGSSPLALFSVMTHDTDGKKMLAKFSTEVELNVEKFDTGDLITYFDECRHVTNGDLYVTPLAMYNFTQMGKSFETMLDHDVIPIVAKDKGIYNNLRRVLHPFGSITLFMAIVLCELDPSFASKPWISYSSTDVANMLRLHVFACDNYSAPSRDGTQKPLAPHRVCRNAPSRGRDQRKLTVEYLPPPVDSIGHHNPAPSNGIPDFTKPCLIDLAFSGTLYEVSNRDNLDKQLSMGNTRGQMDYYYHDESASKYCSAPLFNATGAIYHMFVVVIPIAILTPKYCKDLMTYYSIRFILGSPAMNYSVYVIGREISSPDTLGALAFRRWAAHLLITRLKMYRLAHSGYITDVRAAVKASHAMIDSTQYVKECANLYTDDDFIGLFKRNTSRSTLSVLDSLKPMAVDMSKLSVDADITTHVTSS
jgi:hypothetical protein